MPRLSFMPKEEKFFGLFEQSAANAVRAANELNRIVDTWENVEEGVALITEMEHEGDSITHQIIAQLHRSFVTPFDREDIAQLAYTLDDITDFIHGTADALLIYKISQASRRAKELADVIVDATNEVAKALPYLRNNKHLKQVLTHCVEINRLENAADRIYRSALAELFEDYTDLAEVIKWREIYEELESATDRCEDVANVLEGVALKHA